jgi:hypothetical protein
MGNATMTFLCTVTMGYIFMERFYLIACGTPCSPHSYIKYKRSRLFSVCSSSLAWLRVCSGILVLLSWGKRYHKPSWPFAGLLLHRTRFQIHPHTIIVSARAWEVGPFVAFLERVHVMARSPEMQDSVLLMEVYIVHRGVLGPSFC